MIQTEVDINGIRVPIIKDEGVKYYPISYVGEKILLKYLAGGQLINNGYGDYIKTFSVDYGEATGGCQDTYCISEDGLKKVLGNSKIGRLSVNQKRAMNKLLICLDLPMICENERFTYVVTQEMIAKHNDYIQDCINEVLEENPGIVWQKCTKCDDYFPYHINFFKKNRNGGKEYDLYTVCRNCSGWSESRGNDWIRLDNTFLSSIYREYGDIVYGYYKNHDVLNVYRHWISTWKKGKHFPKIINNIEDKLLIVVDLYNQGYFDGCESINSETIHKVTKFRVAEKGFMKELNKVLFGFYDFEVKDLKTAKMVFFEYLDKHNIIHDGDKKYNLSHYDLIKKSKLITYLRKYYNDDVLSFIIDLYGSEYPAYKFKGGFTKHWDNKGNRHKALKLLIEKDMQIPIEKIPLYLTLESLRKKSSTMRNLLKKHYNNNLWLWVNEVYPDRFIEQDFNITVIRNVFDSAEENMVHDILIDRFKNVLYNQRNTKNTINLMGMQPDWFIFTDDGVWVVEYFGIDIEHKSYNKRIDDYKIRAQSKIEKYKTMNWLRAIYVYPDDLKDNFEGLKEKISVIE